jgi:polyadenylation factor subunit 2
VSQPLSQHRAYATLEAEFLGFHLLSGCLATMAALQNLPELFHSHTNKNSASSDWQPQKYKLPPQPPPQDEARQREIEMATARQLQDGKALKKIRPRRTVDYGGSMGRWITVSYRASIECLCLTYRVQLRKLRPNSTYTPKIHPIIPSVIDVSKGIIY